MAVKKTSEQQLTYMKNVSQFSKWSKIHSLMQVAPIAYVYWRKNFLQVFILKVCDSYATCTNSIRILEKKFFAGVSFEGLFLQLFIFKVCDCFLFRESKTKSIVEYFVLYGSRLHF